MSDDAPKPTTLAELLRLGLRRAQRARGDAREPARALRGGQPLFPGIIGYDDTVVPAVENAILCGHDLIFLGERGQAKSG